MKIQIPDAAVVTQKFAFNAVHPMFHHEVAAVPSAVRDYLKNYRQFVVVGMGGSVLPLKAMVDAMDAAQQIHFLDSLDRRRLERFLNQEHLLFCIASKSGDTLEIRSLMREIIAAKREGDTLIVTDRTKGFLRPWAESHRRPSLEIPSEIGGRFTNFTIFHRALLERVGVDFDQIWKAAQKRVADLKKDPSLLEQLFQICFQDEKKISNLGIWAYGSRFIGLVEWCQQIIAESLGKAGRGIMPILLKGPQDQHSVLQLLREGPARQAYWFLRSAPRRRGPQVVVPGFEDLSNHSLETIEDILAESTFESFKERLSLPQLRQPLVDFQFQEGGADVGDFIGLMQAFIEYAGERMKINAFDQPGVERGKEIARELLKKS